MAITPAFELAISLPFRIDAFGTVAATIDQSKIWQDRVRSVIGTALGERVYQPDFGCNAALTAFDGIEDAISSIETDITVAMQQFLPLLALQSVVVEFDEGTNTISAEVQYSVPNSSSYVVKVGIATIDGTNPIQEEIAWQIQ